MPAKKNPDELTGLECGLMKINSNRKWKIELLEGVINVRTKFTIELLKDNHEKLKEFYIVGRFRVRGYHMTQLKEYTNKKGNKSMKHYIDDQYIGPQPKSKVPVLIPWSIGIDEKTIELFDIDDDGMLIANKERFEKHYNH